MLQKAYNKRHQVAQQARIRFLFRAKVISVPSCICGILLFSSIETLLYLSELSAFSLALDANKMVVGGTLLALQPHYINFMLFSYFFMLWHHF